MPFSYDLPNPDASLVRTVLAPDGTVVRAPTPELEAAVNAELQAQSDAIGRAMAPVGTAVQAQLAGQNRALAGAWQGITNGVQRQLDGQRAALTVATQAIADGVSGQLARQSEQVGTVAMAAALRGAEPAPSPLARPAALSLPAPPLAAAPNQWYYCVDGNGCPVSPVSQSPDCPLGAVRIGPFGSEQDALVSQADAQPRCVVSDVNVHLPPPPPPPCPPGQYPPPCLPGDAIDPATGCCVPNRGGGGGGGACPPGMYPPPCLPGDVIDPVSGCCVPKVICPPPPPPPLNCPPGQFPPPCRPGETLDPVSGCCIPAPPPPDCPVIPPPPKCAWNITDQLPPIGGPDWCKLQGQITAALAALGNAVIESVLGPLDVVLQDMDSEVSVLNTTAGVVIGGGVSVKFPDVVKELIDLCKPLVGTIRDLIACWRQLSRLAPQCQPGTLLGVVVIRGVISALRNFRVGTDAGVWATIDLSLDLPQIQRAADYIVESLCPSVIPGASEAWGAFTAGYVNEDAYRCWTLAAGQDPDLWKPVRVSNGNTISTQDVMLFVRLAGGADNVADEALYRRGWTRDDDRAAVMHLYDRAPTTQELFHWTDTGAIVGEANVILDRDEGFNDWWNDEEGRICRARGMTRDVALNTWRARQPLPYVSELATWLHRLRPEVTQPGDEWDEAKVRQILESSAMPPRAIDAHLSTIYRPIAPVDVMSLVRVTGAGDDGLTPALLSAGFDREDAGALAPVMAAEAWRGYYHQIGGWSIGLYVAAVRAGLTVPPEGRQALDRQGYGQDELSGAVQAADIEEMAFTGRRTRMLTKRHAANAALKGYEVGIIDAPTATTALLAAGYSLASAGAMLSVTDLNLQTARTEEAIGLVKHGFLNGELSQLDAATILATAGVSSVRAAQLAAAWVIEGAATRPMAQVGQIRQWVQEGLLTLAAGRLRLMNLGWRDPDLTLLVSQWGAQLAKAQAAAQSKGAAAAKAAASAAQRVQNQALRQLMRSQPVSALKQWYVAGTLDAQQVTDRLTQYGYDAQSIALYLQDWDAQVARRSSSQTGGGAAAPLPPQRQVPVSRVRAWYLDGIVDEAWARGRLASYGYDTEAVDGLVAQWDQQAAARAARAHEAAPV